MTDASRHSRYEYTNQELELNKVIALMQKEIAGLFHNNEKLAISYDAAIAKAEEIARSKGITEEQLSFMKLQAQIHPAAVGDVPGPSLTWDEIRNEADQAILGDVILEDICSAQDFEDAFRNLKEIDDEFKKKTKLTTTDIIFIAIAVALQCARQYVLQPFLDKHRLSYKQNDDIVKKVIPKSLQDILCGSVPYDAITRLDKTMDSTGLSGANHRYRTLGHDPFFGWIFGPANILSDSLTKTDFITSYNVVNMQIGTLVPTPHILSIAYEQAKNKFNLPVAVVRQAIHFGSDFFSKQGLPIPFISSVNNDISKYLIDNNINMLNVAEGYALSTFLNFLISCIHKLFINDDISPELYEVRTRKILSISNTIASASNIVAVAVTKKMDFLDIGGLLVTIRRLCSDLRFIARVKQEFIEGKLDKEWEEISNDIDRLCGY